MKPILIATCCLLTWVAAAQKISYGNNPAAGKYEFVNGIKLYYEEYGKGEPLLMLHGNGVSISAFSKTIPYFASRYRVIAVDSRAQGKSVDPGNSLSFEMMADVPFQALNASNVPALIVAGDRDVIVPEHTINIFRNIPKAQLWILPNSSHATLIDHADEFNRKTDEFFRSK